MEIKDAIKIIKDNQVSITALINLLDNRVESLQKGIERDRLEIRLREKEIGANAAKLKEDRAVVAALKALANS